MYKKVYPAALIFALLTPLLVFAQGEIFLRNLSLGMRGSDVEKLQTLLNTDRDTQVSLVGAGSPGNETDYFGPATKRAVINFQEKYKEEILLPSGLKSGTGFFGEKTRAKANARRGGTVALFPTSSTTLKEEGSLDTLGKDEVIVMFPSQYSGKPGTMITISGGGFTQKDNTIYFGSEHAVLGAVSWNGQSITFKIPNIPKGRYSLFVKNSRGESNKEQFFIVTDGVTPEPKIENVSPQQASRGSTILVEGSGFTAKGNILLTGVGIFENTQSENGSTLSFVVPANAFPATTSPKFTKFHIPIWIHVVNENGVSNALSFVLEI